MNPPRRRSKNETRGQRAIRFIETFCLAPEGRHVGKPIVLLPFQRRFLLDIFDNPAGTRTAILSIARKNGKTCLIAAIILLFVIGPERRQNAQLVSGAMSRDQAALVYHLAEKMLELQPQFEGLYRCVPSQKRILGLKSNTEFRALAADGSRAHGLSPILTILDEVGQVKGPSSPFLDALLTASGAHDDPLTIMISTQASSDADFLSMRIDDALRASDPGIVCHLYAADKDAGLMNKRQWRKANPALGSFRSERDLADQLSQAERLPATEATARNLLLNQRISLVSLWLAPTPWKDCGGAVDIDVFRRAETVVMGLDLSQRNDLTAAVLCADDDDGITHLLPFVFTPARGIESREARDKAPYQLWVREGKLIAVPGATIDYEWAFGWLRKKLEHMGVRVGLVAFDRWRIGEARQAADRAGFEAGAWREFGQGFKDMSPAVEAFETRMLQERLRHGSHPLLNLAARNAIVVSDPSNNRKLDKSATTQRIDPLVAAVMAVGAAHAPRAMFDVGAMVA